MLKPKICFNIEQSKFLFNIKHSKKNLHRTSKNFGVAISTFFSSQPFSAKLWLHGRTAEIKSSLVFHPPPQLQQKEWISKFKYLNKFKYRGQ